MTTVPDSVRGYNPIADDTLADPFPEYAQIRKSCPIAHSDSLEVPFWVLFTYEDVRNALLDHKTWSARYGLSPVFQKSIGFAADGREHTQFKAIWRRRLASPKTMSSLRVDIERIAENLLNAMLAKGPEVELHDDFALPLPIKVISLLLGIPSDDYPQLKRWSDALMDNAFGKSNSDYLATYAGVCEFFDGYLDARYALLADAGVDEPHMDHVGTILPDDWISEAVCEDFLGRKLTRDEQRVALMGLLVGGNETTTSLITNLMWRLLEEPSRWAAVKADPDRLIPIAIEESLRFDSPVLGMFRTSLCPVTSNGVEIPEKQKLMIAYASANHDPAVFEDPDTFRLDRDPESLKKIATFGFGRHTCPGANLSRMEVDIVMRLFVTMMPDVTINGPTQRSAGYNFWGRRQLPLLVSSATTQI
ncbi:MULTISPECIES: cytochrome P450 [unclassified Mycolicibacterium]|uniref:cytochrome P450 n=1 Tax=unclassified Mycolicibacterium TaxID=2636767 RepID=UPI001390C35E|nr:MULTISPECIES: cytochrome P450 [unclassified Mycolicibacterium]